MHWLVSAFGAFVFGIGVWGLLAPEAVVGVVRGWAPTQRLGIAVGIRAGMGVVFLLAADACRHPTVVTVVGVIGLVAAVLIPMLGSKRLDALIGWFFDLPRGLLRGWFVAALAIGGYFVWVGLPA